MTELAWLPADPDWDAKLRAFTRDPAADWDAATALANARLSPVQTNGLDHAVGCALPQGPPASIARSVRLAVLGSCTMAQLLPAIRVAGLRYGLWITLYECAFGQYVRELADRGSALHAFRPDAVLIALDGHHLAAGVAASADAGATAAALDDARQQIRGLWRLARQSLQCPILHQTPLPLHPLLLGSNEHRHPGSKAGFIAWLNHDLRALADAEQVDLLAIDDQAARDGLGRWHDRALWHFAKQEIAPRAAPLYGDLVARLLAARQGRARKCLVLDLDDTLWGGTVGDAGTAGLILGQGSALGEAFVAFQTYCRELARRGIILAVCSKNDEAVALDPFDRHPDMVLRRADIACFVANWSDKAANIRAIAASLAIGTDALVFADDNPFERDLVRRELPAVAVPEMPDDPSDYAETLAAAGYFESPRVTPEDLARTDHYRRNRARAAWQASFTDLDAYLRQLDMQLVWQRFDRLGLPRIVQLVQKSNQFNLTTRRYTEAELRQVIDDPAAFGLQLRLADRFGDNGVIAIVVGRLQSTDLLIEAWLMSCRVLGRKIEPVTLALIAAQARRLGARRLLGDYVPTQKNGIVQSHYADLGFARADAQPGPGVRYTLDLGGYVAAETCIRVTAG